MEFNVILKSVNDQISADRELVRLNFVSVNDDVAQVDLSLDNLRGLASYLMHLADKHGAPAQSLQIADPFADPA